VTGNQKAFVDESVYLTAGEDGYLLAAVFFRASQLEKVRGALTDLRGRGAGKLHWRDESDARRTLLTAAISNLTLTHMIVMRQSSQHQRSERSRRQCLARLLHELESLRVHDVTFESRGPADDTRNRAMVDALRAQHAITSQLRIAHEAGPAEPMLWAADIVAGIARSSRTGNSTYLGELASRGSLTILELR
jgi:hypothetical protein